MSCLRIGVVKSPGERVAEIVTVVDRAGLIGAVLQAHDRPVVSGLGLRLLASTVVLRQPK